MKTTHNGSVYDLVKHLFKLSHNQDFPLLSDAPQFRTVSVELSDIAFDSKNPVAFYNVVACHMFTPFIDHSFRVVGVMIERTSPINTKITCTIRLSCLGVS